MSVVAVKLTKIRKYFGSESPLGKRIRRGDSRSTAHWLTIVGVVPDVFTGDTGRPWDAMYFFFSSRRRHTIWNCDWSSDVCSSDLEPDKTDAVVDVIAFLRAML